MFSWLKRFAAPVAVVAVFGMASAVHADTIFLTFEGTSVGESGGTEFSYNVTLGEGTDGFDSQIHTGDFFTIYDFAGFIAGSNEQVANWTFSSSLVGVTPDKTAPADDPTLANLTWTYTGSATIDAPAAIGLFSAESIYSNTTVDDYASRDHREQSDGTFVTASYIDTTTVAAVPLPASAWMGLTLLGSVGGTGALKFLRRRRLDLAM